MGWIAEDAAESLGDAIVINETADALLCRCADLGKDLWIPISVIHDDSEVWDQDDAHEGELIVKAWWWQKSGQYAKDANEKDDSVSSSPDGTWKLNF